jgi:hypothetical protein
MNEELKAILGRLSLVEKWNPLTLVKAYEAIALHDGEKVLLQTDDPLYQFFLRFAKTMNEAKTSKEKLDILNAWLSAIRKDRSEGEEWKE